MSRRARRLGDALALGAGLLVPLGFAPFGWWFVPPFAIALALFGWLLVGPRHAFWRGWLFGLGMFGAGVGWVHVSVHQFGGNSLPAALAVTFALVAYLALYPAALAAGLAALWERERAVWRVVLALPSGWLVLEWVRGWLMTGFPWLALGTGQVDAPLGTLAPLGGVLLVGFALALSATLLWAVVAAAGRGRMVAAALLALLWGGTTAWGGRDWTEPAGPPLSVALVQGNIPQQRKWLPEELDLTLERYRALTEQAWGRDLVLWPETAVPVFYEDVADDYLAELEGTAARHGTDLLTGIPFRDQVTNDYYNAMLGLGDGRRAFYFKRHLVPFGEFLPLRDLLGEALRFLHVPMADFSRGPDDQPPMRLAGQPLGITICYEDVFPAEVRSVLPQATVLVNVSNDAWFGESLAPHQHLEIARMRALETGRPLLRGTNTGISAIIGPRGEVLARSPQFEIDVLFGEVEPRQGATPYVLLGDAPLIALALLLGLVTGLRLPRRLR